MNLLSIIGGKIFKVQFKILNIFITQYCRVIRMHYPTLLVKSY
jgi:hypothetical protein